MSCDIGNNGEEVMDDAARDAAFEREMSNRETQYREERRLELLIRQRIQKIIGRRYLAGNGTTELLLDVRLDELRWVLEQVKS